MTAISVVEDIEVVKTGDMSSLRVLFNNQQWRAINVKKTISPKELGEELIQLGKRIIYESSLKDKE
jgi:hypothetical protein